VNNIVLYSLGVQVRVDTSINYIVNENRGPVIIALSLDQPSCLPITIVARPQVRSIPSATGKHLHIGIVELCMSIYV